MDRLPAFELDPYLRELRTEVVATGVEGGQNWARLVDTVLFPEGGGQPADRGWLGDVAVVDVRRCGTEIRHVVERAVKKGPTVVRLDWGRRFDHMQQHTAQHLITAVALDRFGWRTTAFHLSVEISDIELDVTNIDHAQIADLEEAVVAELRAARVVSARRVNPGDMAGLPVRSRGLPENHEGDVRLVEIVGVDLNTCGGTHVRSTAEIETIKLLHTESLRGGTRLYFVAGGRLRRRVRAQEELIAALRRVMDTGDDELVAVAALRGEQVKGLERRLRRTAEALATATAEALASREAVLIEAHFDERDMAFLTSLGRSLIARVPEKTILLTSTTEAGELFVVAAGERAPVDPLRLGRTVAELLEARGGGSGRLYQGKAGSLHRRPEVVALLEQTLSID